MSDVVEKATEVVADAAEFVAEEATDLAVASRRVNASGVGVGLVIGLLAGGGLSFVITRRKLETKYSQIADDEIAEMREHYQDKLLALENTVEKGDLEELVREKGYVTTDPPLAVTPPTAVVEAAEAAREAEEAERPLSAAEVVEQVEEPATPGDRNLFAQSMAAEEWDYHKERRKRSPLRPYIIHRDEREEREGYEEVTLTYYSEDDVLCNERDEVIDPAERDKMIGETHLEKFGHGSGDAHIVYIRNDALELQFEVVYSPNSYAHEVHGFEPEPRELKHGDRRRGRRSFDDE